RKFLNPISIAQKTSPQEDIKVPGMLTLDPLPINPDYVNNVRYHIFKESVKSTKKNRKWVNAIEFQSLLSFFSSIVVVFHVIVSDFALQPTTRSLSFGNLYNAFYHTIVTLFVYPLLNHQTRFMPIFFFAQNNRKVIIKFFIKQIFHFWC